MKVTASRVLDIGAVIQESGRKGLQIVGIVDAQVGSVVAELESMIREGLARETEGGGLSVEGGPLIVLGAEVEFQVGDGSFHLLAFLPDIKSIHCLRRFLKSSHSNPDLSVPRCRVEPREMARIVTGLGGWVSLAHAFTPFKGFFGSCLPSISGILEPCVELAAVELGLSADSDMADRISELREVSFLSNSDAHSASKIAREYNEFCIKSPNFEEITKAVKRAGGRRIRLNVGLDPRLGKYHRSFCLECGRTIKGDPPRLVCPLDPSHHVVTGVLDRVAQIADTVIPLHLEHRPTYRYQIPLEFIPGIGPRTRERLIRRFGSEIAVLHEIEPEEIASYAGQRIASLVEAARKGLLSVRAGGGGCYGKVGIEGLATE